MEKFKARQLRDSIFNEIHTRVITIKINNYHARENRKQVSKKTLYLQ